MSLWSLRRGEGLVGSQLLVSRRCSGRQRGVVLKPVTRSVPRRSMKTGVRARLPDGQAPVEMESLPKICNPMPDASSGTHFTSLEKLEARQLAKRWTATPATKTSFLCRSPHGQFRDDDITACDVSRRKIGRIAPGGKSCEDTRSATESSNRSWKVLQVCSLVEDVEIDGALVAYSNDCSAQGVQHHNG